MNSKRCYFMKPIFHTPPLHASSLFHAKGYGTCTAALREGKGEFVAGEMGVVPT